MQDDDAISQYEADEYVEEEKQVMYHTPKSYSTRRRLKKKSRYEDMDDQNYSTASKNYGCDSTDWTRETSELAKVRHQQRREFINSNPASSEKIQQVVADDWSIDDIDEEEECASIPSEEKTKKEICNEFYQKINKASELRPNNMHDAYSLLFEPDLSINKMIDEIISGNHDMKFSGTNENIGQEEVKDEIEMDINDDGEGAIAMIPEFSIDEVITSIQDSEYRSPLTRQQKKSFKYLNKFQKVRVSNDLYARKWSPQTQIKKQNLKLKSKDPNTWVRKSEFSKSALKKGKRDSSIQKTKSPIKSRWRMDPVCERILNSFYQHISDHQNTSKVLDLFKTTGKGGVIDIVGEPIFPLKMTVDYLFHNFEGCGFDVTSYKSQDSHGKYESPIRRAFKESKNINNMSTNANLVKVIEVEGKFSNKCESRGVFKHTFEIKNSLITRLTVSS